MKSRNLVNLTIEQTIREMNTNILITSLRLKSYSSLFIAIKLVINTALNYEIEVLENIEDVLSVDRLDETKAYDDLTYYLKKIESLDFLNHARIKDIFDHLQNEYCLIRECNVIDYYLKEIKKNEQKTA